MKIENTPTSTPHDIDSELADVLYGSRFDELGRFFYRRTQSPVTAAALLAETFATAAQIRMKRTDRSAQDHEWLTSIATLGLSRYFRAGAPATKAVNALKLAIPEMDQDVIDRFMREPQGDASVPTDTLVLA